MYTRDQGKLRARAKGVRKPHSRLGGNLLPFVPVDLEMVAGSSGWELIVQAHSQNAGSYPDEPLAFLEYAGIVAEGVDKLVPDNEPHPELFEGLLYTFQELREGCGHNFDEPRLLLIVAEFLWKAVIVLGYQPQLEKCVVTGGELAPQGLAWSSQVGGVVSEEGLRNVMVPSMPVQFPKSIVLLRQLSRPEFVAARVNVEGDVAAEACAIVFDYVQTNVGKPLKSYGVLGRM